MYLDLRPLDEHENRAIERLQQHPVFRKIDGIPAKHVREMLMERAHLAVLGFVNLYDRVTMNTTHMGLKIVAREIVRDEFPLGQPTHHEELLHDMEQVGIGPKRWKDSLPGRDTQCHLMDVQASLVQDDVPSKLYEINLATMLRMYGELCVAAEYEKLWPILEKMGITVSSSRFYWPHRIHDRKVVPLNEVAPSPGTHADALGPVLVSMLKTQEEIEYCMRCMNAAVCLRMTFWDQFNRHVL